MRLRLLMFATTLGILGCSARGDSTANTPPTPAQPPIGSIEVALSPATTVVGGTATATATVRSTTGVALNDRTVVWGSSNTGTATIAADGRITALAVGSSTISASADGRSGSAVVTIIPAPVASVVVSPDVGQMTVGGTQQFTATALDGNGSALSGRSFDWTSSNTTVATVSATGLVTALATGTTAIAATSEGRSGAVSIVVLRADVASVTVALGTMTLNPGSTTTATATLRAADGTILTGRSITWSTSNSSVATVSPSGLVTAVSSGSALITATSEGRSGSASLTVPTIVTSVTLVGSQRVKVGDNYSYSAEARDAGGNLLPLPAVFRLADPSAGSMTAAGVLVPQRIGSITIIASVAGSDWTGEISAYDWQVTSTSVSLKSDERVTNQYGTSNYVDLVVSCTSNGYFFVWVSLPHFVTASGRVAYNFDGGTPISQTWDEISSFDALFYPGSNSLSRALAGTIAGSRLFGFAFSEFRSVSRAAFFRPVGLAALLPALYARCPSAIVAGNDARSAAADLEATLRASSSSAPALVEAAQDRATIEAPSNADPTPALRTHQRATERLPMLRAR